MTEDAFRRMVETFAEAVNALGAIVNRRGRAAWLERERSSGIRAHLSRHLAAYEESARAYGLRPGSFKELVALRARIPDLKRAIRDDTAESEIGGSSLAQRWRRSDRSAFPSRQAGGRNWFLQKIRSSRPANLSVPAKRFSRLLGPG